MKEFGRLGDSTSFNGQNLLLAGRGSNAAQFSLQAGITGESTSRISVDGLDSGTLSGWVVPDTRYAGGQSLDFLGSITEELLYSALGTTLYRTSIIDASGTSRELYVGAIINNATTFTLTVFARTEDLGPAGYKYNSLDLTIGASGTFTAVASVNFSVASDGKLSSNNLSASISFNSETANGQLSLDLSGLRTYTNVIPTGYTAETNIFFSGVETASRAGAALTIAKNQLNALSQSRGQLGGAQSRLQTAASVVQTSAQNTSEAESRIRDVDVASEAANLRSQQIRQQSAIQILSLANFQPQLLLRLLNN